MKAKLLIVFLCFPIFVMAQNPNELLTNGDIVKLEKIGLPSSAIISKIKNCHTHFDITVDALVKLKAQGVEPDVITEMINSSLNGQKTATTQKDSPVEDTYSPTEDTGAASVSTGATTVFTDPSASGVWSSDTSGIATKNTAAEKKGNNSVYFVGTWHCINDADTIIISKIGENFILGKNGKTIVLGYQDNGLMNTDPSVGKVIYDSAKGHLFWQGKEFGYVYPDAPTIGTVSSPAFDGASNNNYADSFLGIWHCFNVNADCSDTITIIKDEEHFILDGQGGKTTLDYRQGDNFLKSTDASDKVIFNAFNGHIFWHNREFEYVGMATPQNPDGAADNNTTSNATNYPPGTVGDYITDKLATQESYLFHFISDCRNPKEKVYLDYNLHEENYNQLVADALFNGIVNTNRFERVSYEKYSLLANDTISCNITYSNIVAKADNVQRQSLDGSIIDDYTATVSCIVSVTNYNGTVLFENTFTRGDKIRQRIHIFANATEEQAIKRSAYKLTKQITDFFNGKFPIVTTVNAEDETNRDGSIKTILLKGGDNMGLTEGNKFKIMYNDKQIGEVKVKSTDDNTSVCKVLDGGDAITAKLTAGKTLDAISE